MTGRIHSIQSLGTVDGPGVRFVVFMQGCNLRCGCCHNPDTWDMQGGEEISAEEILEKVLRCKGYFGQNGGITLSGGEPLLQPDFCREVFALCHKNGINTCFDTSGSVLSESVYALLEETDMVLLDIKYATDELYRKHVGCPLQKPIEFLEYLDKKQLPVILRQVIIPGLNYNEQSVLFLKHLSEKYSCVQKIELLPFKKICKVKYEKMGIPFSFDRFETPTKEAMEALINKL